MASPAPTPSKTPTKTPSRRESLLILGSSPALHALKRPQLLALCKKHGLKANGKNVEIIERLKEHGQAIQRGEVDLMDDDNDTTPPASPSKHSPTKSLLEKSVGSIFTLSLANKSKDSLVFNNSSEDPTSPRPNVPVSEATLGQLLPELAEVTAELSAPVHAPLERTRSGSIKSTKSNKSVISLFSNGITAGLKKSLSGALGLKKSFGSLKSWSPGKTKLRDEEELMGGWEDVGNESVGQDEEQDKTAIFPPSITSEMNVKSAVGESDGELELAQKPVEEAIEEVIQDIQRISHNGLSNESITTLATVLTKSDETSVVSTTQTSFAVQDMTLGDQSFNLIPMDEFSFSSVPMYPPPTPPKGTNTIDQLADTPTTERRDVGIRLVSSATTGPIILSTTPDVLFPSNHVAVAPVIEGISPDVVGAGRIIKSLPKREKGDITPFKPSRPDIHNTQKTPFASQMPLDKIDIPMPSITSRSECYPQSTDPMVDITPPTIPLVVVKADELVVSATEKMMMELNERVQVGGDVLPEVEAEFKATFGEFGTIGAAKPKPKGRYEAIHARQFSKMASIADRPGKRPAPEGERSAKRFKPSVPVNKSETTLANVTQKKQLTEREAARRKAQLETARRRRQSVGKPAVPVRRPWATGNAGPREIPGCTVKKHSSITPAPAPTLCSNSLKAKQADSKLDSPMKRTTLFKTAALGFKSVSQTKPKISQAPKTGPSTAAPVKKMSTTSSIWKKDVKQTFMPLKKKAPIGYQVAQVSKVRVVSQSGDGSFVRIDNETMENVPKTETVEQGEKRHAIVLSPKTEPLSPNRANVTTPSNKKVIRTAATTKGRALNNTTTKTRAIARSRPGTGGMSGPVKKKTIVGGPTNGRKVMSTVNREGNRTPWR